MSDSSATCWSVIAGAAAGSQRDRREFARRYEPIARAYLAARWSRGQEIDDAVQDVFLACFEQGGVLQRADPERGFRAFFYGVVRNVARRFEERRRDGRERPAHSDLDEVQADAFSLSEAFDRAWAQSILAQDAQRLAMIAREAGPEAQRRVQILRLRFEDDLPIRDIAKRWDADPTHVHRQYARARREFKRALLEVVAFHHPRDPDEVENEAARLLDFFV